MGINWTYGTLCTLLLKNITGIFLSQFQMFMIFEEIFSISAGIYSSFFPRKFKKDAKCLQLINIFKHFFRFLYLNFI